MVFLTKTITIFSVQLMLIFLHIIAVVHINALKKSFKPGAGSYDRTLELLKKLQMDFLIIFKGSDPSTCPSSIAKYFHDLKYEVNLVKPSKESFSMQDIDIPIFDGGKEASQTSQDKENEALSILDCLGCYMHRLSP